jgi:hypothetical protein
MNATDELMERLRAEIRTLADRVRTLETQMDLTAERQAQFGRPRYLIWGKLEETLNWNGSADVQLMAREETSPGVWEWVEKWIMEDVLAPPVIPEGTCIPGISPTTGEPTWVVVAWFPLDEEYFVIGAETCPSTDCDSDSSSS